MQCYVRPSVDPEANLCPVEVCVSQNTDLIAGKAVQAHHAAVDEQASNADQQQKQKW